MRHYTAEELADMPTLAVGQADDLKIENHHRRVWLCRCGVADGMPYDDMVTVEAYIDGRWVEIDRYPG
jgi:CDGSH-type Zn-finger protein